jgi:phospholipase C
MTTPIKNIVVLMLENRSFDHLVGYLRTDKYPIDGVRGNESNYVDPLTRKTRPVPVSDDAPYVPDLDPSPGHEFGNVAVQIHGANPAPTPSVGSNVGYVADYDAVAGAGRGGAVMRCFASGKLPAMHALAQEFALCDAWFASMPGPTWPNRFFAHCATSGGFVDNAVRNYPMRTLYQNLEAANINWRIYYHDFPQSLALANQRPYFLRGDYELFDQAFLRDCASGLLPQFSFIEPRYFNEGASRANDQHPIHGVLGGDALIAAVYEGIRNSLQWPETMLIVLWDEHGGFFDHRLAPVPSIPPDGSTEFFDFRSYGVRVPAIVVSAYTPKATIDSLVYDHTSLAATAKEIFGLPAFLTARDAKSNTVSHLYNGPLRTDVPAALPGASQPEMLRARSFQSDSEPPNDLQVSLLALARSLNPAARELVAAPPPPTEGEAAAEARAHLSAFAAARQS